MSWIDYLLIGGIALGIALAVRHLKKGKSCCGDCRNCGSGCKK